MKKYKIIDYFVHQGHQREFAKTGHDFYLIGANGKVPNWNQDHRPLPENVNLISESEALEIDFDIAMIRTPIAIKRYQPFLSKGTVPIAVIQTTDPHAFPTSIKHIVWNSKIALQKNIGFYRNRKQHYIVHGYDPEEFRPIDIAKNSRVLTIANHFKKRDKIMGYDIWEHVRRVHPVCDVIGSKNEDVNGAIDHLDSLQELIETYNHYSIYFNPTRKSAMPRSRAEAAMCGMPIVSTMFYDFSLYFKPGKDAFLSNSKEQLSRDIGKLLKSEQMREDYGQRSRELAIKYFHINDYIDRWNQVFELALRDS